MEQQDKYDYYGNQLKHVLKHDKVSDIKIKIDGQESTSNWLDINKESIAKLRLFLNEAEKQLT